MSNLVEKKLLPAIKEGDTEVVKSLLDTSKLNCRSLTGSAPKRRNHLQYTADKCEILLQTAIELEREEIIGLLVKYFDITCDVLDRSCNNLTPLMIASRDNKVELVKILLKHGADANIALSESISDYDYNYELIDEKAESALIFAVDEQNEKIVEILLNSGANVMKEYNSPFAHKTWTDIFFHLIRNGPRSTMDLLMNFGPGSKQVTAQIFSLSIKMEEMNLFEELLERGVDIEAENFKGYTPLMVAIKNDNFDIAYILLDNGANVNSVTDDGDSALQFAVANNHWGFVQFLLDNGADVNLKPGSHHESALESAFERRTDIFALLLKCGAQIDIDGIDFIMNFDVKLLEMIVVNIDKSSIVKNNAQTLLKYVVKWQAEDNFVTSLDSQAISKNLALKSYYEKCKEEMKRVREKGFSSTTFLLYDVLKSNTLDQLTSFARVEEIGDYLKTKKFKAYFPIYSDLIIKQFKKGVERKFLLQRVCCFFLTLSIKCELPNLTILCTNKIFDLLYNGDLINLRRAYYC